MGPHSANHEASTKVALYGSLAAPIVVIASALWLPYISFRDASGVKIWLTLPAASSLFRSTSEIYLFGFAWWLAVVLPIGMLAAALLIPRTRGVSVEFGWRAATLGFLLIAWSAAAFSWGESTSFYSPDLGVYMAALGFVFGGWALYRLDPRNAASS